MTKQLQRIADALVQTLQSGPWPPRERFTIDAWATLLVWGGSGEHVFRVRHRPPAMSPDLRLAEAPIKHKATCFVMDREEWIVVARVDALEPIPVHYDAGKVLAYRQPLLTYFTPLEKRDQWASGHFNLRDQPTPRHLKLIPGEAKSGEDATRVLGVEDVAVESVRLAKALPWFFAN